MLRLTQLTGTPVTRDNLAELSLKHDIESDAVYRLWTELPTGGARVTYLDVEKDGRVDLEKLEAAITDKTILVSIMLANNEIGTVQPIAEIGKLCRAEGRALPLRRGAGRRQGALRRGGDEGRPGLPLGAQDVRPQGRGRAVRAPQAARAHRAPSSTAAATSAACARAR